MPIRRGGAEQVCRWIHAPDGDGKDGCDDCLDHSSTNCPSSPRVESGPIQTLNSPGSTT